MTRDPAKFTAKTVQNVLKYEMAIENQGVNEHWFQIAGFWYRFDS